MECPRTLNFLYFFYLLTYLLSYFLTYLLAYLINYLLIYLLTYLLTYYNKYHVLLKFLETCKSTAEALLMQSWWIYPKLLIAHICLAYNFRICKIFILTLFFSVKYLFYSIVLYVSNKYLALISYRSYLSSQHKKVFTYYCYLLLLLLLLLSLLLLLLVLVLLFFLLLYNLAVYFQFAYA